jgi:hypothetical protein
LSGASGEERKYRKGGQQSHDHHNTLPKLDLEGLVREFFRTLV